MPAFTRQLVHLISQPAAVLDKLDHRFFYCQFLPLLECGSAREQVRPDRITHYVKDTSMPSVYRPRPKCGLPVGGGEILLRRRPHAPSGMHGVKLPSEAQFFDVLEAAVVDEAFTFLGARSFLLCPDCLSKTLAHTLVTVPFPIVREDLARPKRSYDEITRLVDNAGMRPFRMPLVRHFQPFTPNRPDNWNSGDDQQHTYKWQSQDRFSYTRRYKCDRPR
jgi:hypothetical protein